MKEILGLLRKGIAFLQFPSPVKAMLASLKGERTAALD